MNSALRHRSDKDPEAAWQMTAPGHIGLLHAHFVRQAFPRHFHDGFVVCVNERGAHASWYRGSTVIIPEGAITVVSPGEVHTGRPVPGLPWHYRAMYVDAELLTTLAIEMDLPAGTTPPGLPWRCLRIFGVVSGCIVRSVLFIYLCGTGSTR
jgi:hypothetical protein